MSEKTKYKSKPQESTPDKSYDRVTSLPEPTNPKTIFFSEWLEDENNWTSFSGAVPKGTGKNKEKLDKTEKVDAISGGFVDPHALFLPFCLQDLKHDWKRPRDLFPEYQIVISTDNSAYSELLNESAHLVQSDFIRSFISSIHILEYLARTTNFEQEGPTSKQVPHTSGSWKPWHHIYGGGKLGAATASSPQVNAIGKYFVRLFWLGAWRKVVIDDFLPVDATGHVLLPSLRIPPKPSRVSTCSIKEKQQKPYKSEQSSVPPTVELWPFLLAKALLKLANLTMKKDQDLLDFNIMHSLTGWVLHRLELKGIPSEEMWEICKTYTRLYTWEHPKTIAQIPDTEKRGKKDRKVLPNVKVPTPEAQNSSYIFMALCKDMRNLEPSTVNGMSPCWGHEFLIEECRDIPLEKPPPDLEYSPWKKFRWMEWAKSKGLITESVSPNSTKYLKCLSPFKNFDKLVVHNITPPRKSIQFPLRKNLALLQKQPPIFDIVEKMDQSDKHKAKDKKIVSEINLDPSMWISFDDLCYQLISFYVLYKPSVFNYKSRVSDLELHTISDCSSPKDKSPSKLNLRKNDVLWPNVMMKRENIPLYFLIESLNTKKILVNLAQAGDLERLVPLENELSEHNSLAENDQIFEDRRKMNQEETSSQPKKFKLNRSGIHSCLKRSYVLFEKYKWDTAATGKVEFFLNTYGNSSALLKLKPGRHVFRVWAKSDFSYCITFLADTPFSVGCFEDILDEIAKQPMRITQFNQDISDCFGNMIGGLGSPGFPDLLRRFYRSYLPRGSDKDLTKAQRAVIHNAFQKYFLQFLHSSQDFDSLQKTMKSLRIMFLDPNIHIPKESHDANQDSKRASFEFQTPEEKIICEQASTKLQDFFKMVQMRMLSRRHRQDNQYFREIRETLRQLYTDYFSREQRDFCLGSIVRNFFKDVEIADFLPLYEIYRDFKWDVLVQTYSGSSELTRDYVILCRYVLRCYTDVILAIHLFCSLSHYALRIIDNDTGDEVYRFTNQVFPRVYKPNSFGYTIIGFAWHGKEVKLINWKLAMISAKTTTTVFEMEDIKPVSMNAIDHYLPVCGDLIGKFSIFTRENVILTFRISCSYENVEFNVKLFDPDQNLLVDLISREKIVLPSVFLKGVVSPAPEIGTSRSLDRINKLEARKGTDKSAEKKESIFARRKEEMEFESKLQVYSLEFHVVDNSWPLTEAEWDVVRKLREEKYFVNSYSEKDTAKHDSPWKNALKSMKDSRRSMMKKVKSIEKPWYLLQYSFSMNAQVVLLPDGSEEDKVHSLKQFWYEKDENRYTRSFNLRQNYLKQYQKLDQFPEQSIHTSPVDSQSRLSDSSLETNANSRPVKEEDDENAKRTNKYPKSAEINVPPFDLSPYYRSQASCPLEFGKQIMKVQKDHETDREERRIEIMEYSNSLTKKRQDMEHWKNESNKWRTKVFLWYSDCRKASEKVLQENQSLRKNFFDKWAPKKSVPEKKQNVKVKKK